MEVGSFPEYESIFDNIHEIEYPYEEFQFKELLHPQIYMSDIKKKGKLEIYSNQQNNGEMNFFILTQEYLFKGKVIYIRKKQVFLILYF